MSYQYVILASPFSPVKVKSLVLNRAFVAQKQKAKQGFIAKSIQSIYVSYTCQISKEN